MHDMQLVGFELSPFISIGTGDELTHLKLDIETKCGNLSSSEVGLTSHAIFRDTEHFLELNRESYVFSLYR